MRGKIRDQFRGAVVALYYPRRRGSGSSDSNVFSNVREMASGIKAGEDILPVAVKGLCKSFGERAVLKGIDLAVRSGETVAVLGRSGTGKSVLLRLLVGLQQPDSGSIRIHGKDITGLELDELNSVRMKIGFLFQQAALYDSLTVGDNVEFPLKRHTALSETDRKQRVRELLTSVGMDGEQNKMPSDLSGGMQKRVGLARALALDPDILLFDEPTSGLDPITSTEVIQLILKLKEERNLTSIVVTHDVLGAKHFADRVVLLKQGNVVVDGTFGQLTQSLDPFVVEFLKDAA
jgi:phospholipid/cholesterol/gamma-HCH transport system ATP-binding protein